MSALNRSRLTAEERIHRAYKNTVRALIMKTFGLSEEEMNRQDRIWGKWCAERKGLELSGQRDSSRSGEYMSLYGRLMDPRTRDCFKARILAVLLAPRIRLAAFPCESSFPEESYTKDWLGFHSYAVKMIQLPATLHVFLATLLESTLDAFGWERVTSKKISPYFGEKGVERYNQLILQVLPILPVESPQAERLFNGYKMTYPYGLVSKEGEDHLFRELLEAPIPTGWKERADAERRAHIWQQRPQLAFAFDEAVFESWQSLIRGYAYDVQTLLSKMESCDVSVLEGQIAWLLGLAAAKQLPPIWWHDSFTHVLAALPKERYGDLRCRFARHLLLSEMPIMLTRTRPTPILYDEEGCRLVNELIAEVGEGDPEFSMRLSQMVQLYQVKVQSRALGLVGLQSAEEAMY